MVQFILEDPEPLLYHNEPIWRNDVIVGYITSGMFGHTIGRSIGMGYVNNEDGATPDFVKSGSYEIEIACKRYAANAKSLLNHLMIQRMSEFAVKSIREIVICCNMKSHSRVVIVGGGMMGVGLLYHLALEGWEDCMLIEKGELTSGSTWHAAGQCPSFIGNYSMAQIHHHSNTLYPKAGRTDGTGYWLEWIVGVFALQRQMKNWIGSGM